MKTLPLVVLLMVTLFLISGCGGGGAKNYNISYSTTIGEELSDLQHAYQSGAIDHEEYEEQRKKILERGS